MARAKQEPGRRVWPNASVAFAFAALAIVAGCTSGTVTSTADRDPAGTEAATAPTSLAVGNLGGVVVAPTPTPDGPRPLLIATILGETGVMAPLDGPALAGVVAEAERLNDAGGVLGRTVEVQRFDTNSRHSVAERVMERLIKDPPDLIITSCDVDFSMPVLDLADAAGLITISPCADDAGYLTGAFGPRNFTLGAPAESTGEVAARTSFERYGPTAMVLRDVTSPEAGGFCDGFERTFREIGGIVIFRDEFSYDTLGPLQDRLVKGGGESSFIVVCSHVPGGFNGAPAVITMVRTVGFQAPIVSGSSVDEPGWIPSVPLIGDMTFITWSSAYGNDPDDRVNEVVRRASQNGQTPGPGVSTVLGADAVQAWARAVETARDAGQDRVAAALGSFRDEPFATGAISFVDGARMDIGRLYRVVDVRDGQLTVVGIEEVAD